MDANFYLSRLLPFDPASTRIWKFPKLDRKQSFFQITDKVVALFQESIEPDRIRLLSAEQESEVSDVLEVCKALGLLFQVGFRTYRPSKTLLAVIYKRLDYLIMWQIALLEFQFPCNLPVDEFRNLDPRMQVKPFLMLLQLLHDPELGYRLDKKEVKLVIVYGNNPSCFEICKERILDYRSKGTWTIVRNFKHEWYDLDSQASAKSLLERLNSQAESLTNITIDSKLAVSISSELITHSRLIDPMYQEALRTGNVFLETNEIPQYHSELEEALYKKVSQFLVCRNGLESVAKRDKAIQNTDDRQKSLSAGVVDSYEFRLAESIKQISSINHNLPSAVLETLGIPKWLIKEADSTFQMPLKTVLPKVIRPDTIDYLDKLVKLLHKRPELIINQYLNQKYIQSHLYFHNSADSETALNWRFLNLSDDDVKKLKAIASYCKSTILSKKENPIFSATSLMRDYFLKIDTASAIIALIEHDITINANDIGEIRHATPALSTLKSISKPKSNDKAVSPRTDPLRQGQYRLDRGPVMLKDIPDRNLTLPMCVLEMCGISASFIEIYDPKFIKIVGDFFTAPIKDIYKGPLYRIVTELSQHTDKIIISYLKSEISQDSIKTFQAKFKLIDKRLQTGESITATFFNPGSREKDAAEKRLYAIANFCRKEFKKLNRFIRLDYSYLKNYFNFPRDIAEALLFTLQKEDYLLGSEKNKREDEEPLRTEDTSATEVAFDDGKAVPQTSSIITDKPAMPAEKLKQVIGLEEIVSNEFPEGINLNIRSQLTNIKEIIKVKYPRCSISEVSNAALIRQCQESLLDWGFGIYLSPLNLQCSKALRDEILDFIKDDPKTSLYISEIYYHFQGRIKFETNISNQEAFRGFLKHILSDQFSVTSLKVEKGEVSDDSSDEIKELIQKNDCKPISDKKIISTIFGGDGTLFKSEIRKCSKVIKWGNGQHFHIDFLEDVLQIHNQIIQIINQQLEQNGGFTSMSCLYSECSSRYGQILGNNYILYAIDLYYYSQYFFRNDFSFQQPNILPKGSPATSIPELLKNKFCNTEFIDTDVYTYGAYFSWSQMSITNGIIAMAQTCHVRISESRYIPKALLKACESWISEVNRIIEEEIGSVEYCLSSSLEPFNVFPVFEYPWNAYLLESFLSLDESKFRVLPVDKENRTRYFYIIVRKASNIINYNELVAEMLKQHSVSNLTETEMAEFLLDTGLSEGGVPTMLKRDHRFHFSGNEDSYSTPSSLKASTILIS